MKSSSTTKSVVATVLLLALPLVSCAIDRERVVRKFNPHRNASNNVTPMQVGNGNIAFGADITGMQSILPYGVLSSWGWHNSTSTFPKSAPTADNATTLDFSYGFTGLEWLTNVTDGQRLVQYNQPNSAEAQISQWLISNPHRINLGRTGLLLNGKGLAEHDLTNKSQYTDLFTGGIYSTFHINNTLVSVQTYADPNSDSFGFAIESSLLSTGALSVFFDYPYASDADKFDDPFVGIFNATVNHTTVLQTRGKSWAQVEHTLDATTYYNTIEWQGSAKVSGPLTGTHRYTLQPTSGPQKSISFASTYTPGPTTVYPASFPQIKAASMFWWQSYWEAGAFVDLTGTKDDDAIELQRRTILSQYYLAINNAGTDPPQESGLTNNGWYGKFHLEEVFWNLIQWPTWGKWYLFERTSGFYNRFLPSSIERAKAQGFAGARWGKESSPDGRSAPGEINSLLIWQQPHPIYWANLEYTAFPTPQTLAKWDVLVTETADFMADVAWYNATTKVYNLGPPLYPVSETGNPNATNNPTFELHYWRLGLSIASEWRTRQNRTIPAAWTTVLNGLAPLPVENDTYVLYEGVPNFWNDPTLTEDHPGFLGISGWLPPLADVNTTILQNTREMVYQTWNFTYSYGWDFPITALNALRLGDSETAVSFLLHSAFQFDDIGQPVGGSRVPTPYYPASGSLLFAIAGLCGGFTESPGMKWPGNWTVVCEDFPPVM